MNEKHEHLFEIARRLFVALDSQTTALIQVHGSNIDAWPQYMKDAMMALEHATTCDWCNWTVTKYK